MVLLGFFGFDRGQYSSAAFIFLGVFQDGNELGDREIKTQVDSTNAGATSKSELQRELVTIQFSISGIDCASKLCIYSANGFGEFRGLFPAPPDALLCYHYA